MNPYLSPRLVWAALQALAMRPSRGMSQNFLVDSHALAQIIAAANLSPGDLVVEVGPGLGVLTWELLHAGAHVIAVELDKRLAARMGNEFLASLPPLPGQPEHHKRDEAQMPLSVPLQIIQSDVLHLPPADILKHAATDLGSEPRYQVVANLPYAITSPVLRHFLEQAPQPQQMVVLVQWEVARRITAAPGDLSMLAHAMQFYAEPEIIARVPSDSFVPKPAVDSAILRLRVRVQPAVQIDDVEGFFRIIKASFLQPRKKLSNALPGGLAALGEPCERATVVAALEAAGVSPHRRAETVSLAEWGAVYRALRQG